MLILGEKNYSLKLLTFEEKEIVVVETFFSLF